MKNWKKKKKEERQLIYSTQSTMPKVSRSITNKHFLKGWCRFMKNVLETSELLSDPESVFEQALVCFVLLVWPLCNVL